MSEIYAAGNDLGTMFLQSIRDDGKGGIAATEVRNCYREMPYAEEFEDQMKQNASHFIRDGEKLYVLGNEAYIQAGMAEMGADILGSSSKDILQRPMKDGVLNSNSPKTAMMILRELQKVVVETGVGPARPGEILCFSVPANPIDSDLNNSFHAKMAEKHFTSMGFECCRPLGEGLAVVLAECPFMHAEEKIPFTGIGISMGSGMCNFCLAERGTPLDEWSLCRAGDWIDANAARMTGQPKTKILRIKEKVLNFNTIDNIPSSDNYYDILLGLDCYYTELINYAFKIFADRFKSNRGSIDHPIDIILSGGTCSIPGFDKKARNILGKMSLPFEIGEIKMAGDGDTKKMLQTVAKGCYLRAKQAAKKATAAKAVSEK